jgi:hypothetical protein
LTSFLGGCLFLCSRLLFLLVIEDGIEKLDDELLLFAREEFDRSNFLCKLIKVTNGTGANTSTTEYVTFDILGRVTRSKQTTDGVVYGTDAAPMTYTYNLSGAMIEQKYPSGRVVKNVLDNDGDLSIVQSKKNANSGFFNYAKNFTYTSAGAVSSMQLGNNRWESTQFNSRLQPTQIALGRRKGRPTN